MFFRPWYRSHRGGQENWSIFLHLKACPPCFKVRNTYFSGIFSYDVERLLALLLIVWFAIMWSGPLTDLEPRYFVRLLLPCVFITWYYSFQYTIFSDDLCANGRFIWRRVLLFPTVIQYDSVMKISLDRTLLLRPCLVIRSGSSSRSIRLVSGWNRRRIRSALIHLSKCLERTKFDKSALELLREAQGNH